MTVLRRIWNRVAGALAGRRSRGGHTAGDDFGGRLDASRNAAHRRGDTTQQGPTWGGGPY